VRVSDEIGRSPCFEEETGIAVRAVYPNEPEQKTLFSVPERVHIDLDERPALRIPPLLCTTVLISQRTQYLNIVLLYSDSHSPKWPDCALDGSCR